MASPIERGNMPKLRVSKEALPESQSSEIDIYPDGDKSRPRIGVLKIDKGKSNLILDPGILPYQSF
jgi:hypothetical protein